MMRCILEEELGAIFKMPINLDLGQARNKCEIYYHHVRPIEISVTPGSHYLFVGEIQVETMFNHDMRFVGILTSCCHDYDSMYNRATLKSSDKLETPLFTTQDHITMAKELTFCYKIDYDKVRETIKTINWS